LERVFEEEDFFEVVEAMNSDKAPTLTVTLWHSSKLIGKRRYHEVFHDLYARDKFERNLNATFIVFISKMLGAGDLKDFQPIGLMSGIYIIISKVLANRLKIVMEKISSKFQNAFIRGR
jgi:hypothetical protein